MDIKNIHVGDTYKNYKELCSALGIEPKTSDSKVKQLREIGELVRYHKLGRSFIIDEIYEKKKADLPSISPSPPKNTSKPPLYYHFSNYVQTILMQYLVYSSSGVLDVSMTTLCKIVGLLGNDYDSYRAAGDFVKQFPDIPYTEIHFVKNKAYRKVYSIVNYALNRLRSKRLIDYQKVYIITEKNNKTRVADTEEISKILTAERDALTEMGYSTINPIYLRGQMDIYYSIVMEKLNKTYEWKSVTRKIHIIYLRDQMIEEIERLSLIAAKAELNQNLMSYLEENISKEHEKRYPYCHCKAKAFEKIFYEKLEPEDCLYKYPLDKCMRRFRLIASAFVEYIEEDDKY